jgi:hypothetical protein
MLIDLGASIMMELCLVVYMIQKLGGNCLLVRIFRFLRSGDCESA